MFISKSIYILNIYFRSAVTAILITHKFYTDSNYSNKFFGSLCNISLEEMNSLERQFLFLIDFNILVTTNDFETLFYGLIDFFESG